MNEYLKPENISLFILFVLPGLVAYKVHDLLVPSPARKLSELAAGIVAFGGVNLAVWSWTVPSFADATWVKGNPSLHKLGVFCVTFVGPIILTILFVRLRKSKFLRGHLIHPTPTAWDYFFQKGSCAYIRFHMADGTTVGGKYAEKSFASSFPQDGDVFVEELWSLDNKGKFVERIEGTGGAIIKRSQCNLIEILEGREE